MGVCVDTSRFCTHQEVLSRTIVASAALLNHVFTSSDCTDSVTAMCSYHVWRGNVVEWWFLSRWCRGFGMEQRGDNHGKYPPLLSGAKDEICTDIFDELRFKLKDDGRSERWKFICTVTRTSRWNVTELRSASCLRSWPRSPSWILPNSSFHVSHMRAAFALLVFSSVFGGHLRSRFLSTFVAWFFRLQGAFEFLWPSQLLISGRPMVKGTRRPR